MQTVLEAVNWRRANAATRKEVRNREIYSPPVSLYRWWARRPRALIGALLEASRASPDALVSDPFSGGGTVAMEAIRRGFRIHAQDINPWAVWGLSTALDSTKPEELENGIKQFLAKLEAKGTSEYATNCPEHGASTTLAAFWVREAKCSSCSGSIFLYPYTLITIASRSASEDRGFYGCPACGAITEGKIGHVKRCSQCRHRLPDEKTPLTPKRVVSCPHCASELTSTFVWRQRPNWRLALVHRWCNHGTTVHFDVPTRKEAKHRTKHRRLPGAFKETIPPGNELNVLRRAGFRRWADIYPPRQFAALLSALDTAASLDTSEAIRNRILLAIAGAGEMAGYLCRWDRFHPKAFEALANHRFSPLGLAVEQNPLAIRGRGTVPRRLEASLRASRWIQESVADATHRHGSNPRRPTNKTERATVTLGSSSAQPLGNDSVDLVVTDPPYYDAVQYGELSALFLAWLKTATGRQLPPDALNNEAVPSTVRNSGAEHYERMLTSIFLETARTLAPDGTVLLTYHSTDFRGWAALGAALHASNLCIVALGIGHSENELDHPKRDRRVFTRDLVIECRKRSASAETPPVIVTKSRTSEARELLAAGYAIATSGASKESMSRTFRALTSRLHSRLIYVQELKQGNS